MFDENFLCVFDYSTAGLSKFTNQGYLLKTFNLIEEDLNSLEFYINQAGEYNVQLFNLENKTISYESTSRDFKPGFHKIQRNIKFAPKARYVLGLFNEGEIIDWWYFINI